MQPRKFQLFLRRCRIVWPRWSIFDTSYNFVEN